MLSRDRRLGVRIPLDLLLSGFAADRPLRALASNVSPTGIYLNTVKLPGALRPTARTVALEFELPGTGEVIWASGEVRYEREDRHFCGTGVRFTAMADAHARLLRDYCVESRRSELAGLLARIREPARASAAA